MDRREYQISRIVDRLKSIYLNQQGVTENGEYNYDYIRRYIVPKACKTLLNHFALSPEIAAEVLDRFTMSTIGEVLGVDERLNLKIPLNKQQVKEGGGRTLIEKLKQIQNGEDLEEVFPESDYSKFEGLDLKQRYYYGAYTLLIKMDEEQFKELNDMNDMDDYWWIAYNRVNAGNYDNPWYVADTYDEMSYAHFYTDAENNRLLEEVANMVGCYDFHADDDGEIKRLYDYFLEDYEKDLTRFIEDCLGQKTSAEVEAIKENTASIFADYDGYSEQAEYPVDKLIDYLEKNNLNITSLDQLLIVKTAHIEPDFENLINSLDVDYSTANGDFRFKIERMIDDLEEDKDTSRIIGQRREMLDLLLTLGIPKTDSEWRYERADRKITVKEIDADKGRYRIEFKFTSPSGKQFDWDGWVKKDNLVNYVQQADFIGESRIIKKRDF